VVAHQQQQVAQVVVVQLRQLLEQVLPMQEAAEVAAGQVQLVSVEQVEQAAEVLEAAMPLYQQLELPIEAEAAEA
jgi:hypothetical protein